MSSSTKQALIAKASLALAGAGATVAIAATVAAAFAGWHAQTAVAAPTETETMLGVQAATAVAVGPEVSAAEKGAVSAQSMRVRAGLRLGAPVARKVATHAHARRVVRKHVHRARVARSGWLSAKVSWYGPGFYGHTMAGGGKLRRNSMVVAHRSLPFGTRIEFRHGGKKVIAVVRDRGPFVYSRTFDLGPGTARALGFSGVGKVTYRIL